eukprot:3239419-Rhodomonas_salina.5
MQWPELTEQLSLSAYALAMRCPVLAMRCPVLTCRMVLPGASVSRRPGLLSSYACNAVSGTEIAYLRSCCPMSCTDIP